MHSLGIRCDPRACFLFSRLFLLEYEWSAVTAAGPLRYVMLFEQLLKRTFACHASPARVTPGALFERASFQCNNLVPVLRVRG
jgi:hypothetical protein